MEELSLIVIDCPSVLLKALDFCGRLYKRFKLNCEGKRENSCFLFLCMQLKGNDKLEVGFRYIVNELATIGVKFRFKAD